MDFPISGVHCSPLVPPLVAFLISSVTAAAGVSGAFLLLPFQMSALGFVSPAVSPTNLIYNAVALPGGVCGYMRERRMAWPLAWIVVAGTLPGMCLGAVIRARYLLDPRAAKLFVGLVLLYLAWRLLRTKSLPRGEAPGAEIKTLALSRRRVAYAFGERTFAFAPGPVLLLGLAVGVVGGIYGIGGGAILAPFLVGILGLPVYTVGGAALFSTLITSLAGVVSFQLLAVQPDWALGALFGLGGLAGTYAGARLQKHLPERWIRLLLSVVAAGLAADYIRLFV